MNVIRQRYVLFLCAVFPVCGMNTVLFPPKDTTNTPREVSVPVNIPVNNDATVLATCLTMNRYLGGSQQCSYTPEESFENSPERCLMTLTHMTNQMSMQKSSLMDAYGSSGNSTR